MRLLPDSGRPAPRPLPDAEMPVPACRERRSLPFSLPLKDWPCPRKQGFFLRLFPVRTGLYGPFPRLSGSLPNIFRFAFGFCKKDFLTCCLLLYKIQTQGRAEGSKVRGDRQKPDGSAAWFPQVPSTESRKPGRRKPPAGQRSTAGTGTGRAAEPGVSERGAPGLLAGSKLLEKPTCSRYMMGASHIKE